MLGPQCIRAYHSTKTDWIALCKKLSVNYSTKTYCDNRVYYIMQKTPKFFRFKSPRQLLLRVKIHNTKNKLKAARRHSYYEQEPLDLGMQLLLKLHQSVYLSWTCIEFLFENMIFFY